MLEVVNLSSYLLMKNQQTTDWVNGIASGRYTKPLTIWFWLVWISKDIFLFNCLKYNAHRDPITRLSDFTPIFRLKLPMFKLVTFLHIVCLLSWYLSVCNVQNCWYVTEACIAGQVYDLADPSAPTCKNCSVGYYQPIALPNTTDTCVTCKAGLTTATEGSTKESDCVCKLSCRCNHGAIKLGHILIVNNITRHKVHPLYLNYICYNCCSSGFSLLVFKSKQSGRTKAIPCLLMSSASMVFHGGNVALTQLPLELVAIRGTYPNFGFEPDPIQRAYHRHCFREAFEAPQ